MTDHRQIRLTYHVVNTTISVMELDTRSAALQLGVSQRQIQRLARSGRVNSRSIAGRKVVAGRSLVAATRSRGFGRRWDDRTVAAAIELLDSDTTTQIVSSQRSRLRARLREISMQDLAYQVLADRASLWRETRSSSRSKEWADELTSTGDRLEIRVESDAAKFARQERLLEDLDGDILLIELDTKANRVVEDIALYAFGDTRTSSVAAQRIRARREKLQVKKASANKVTLP